MKVRVFKDGTKVYLNAPAAKYQPVNGGKIEDCPIPIDLQGLAYFVCEGSDIPDDVMLEQLYIDGTASLANLKKDSNWDIKVKPAWLIRKEEMDKLQEQANTELAKPTPDANVLAVLNAKMGQAKEKVAEGEENIIWWYQKALSNLDAKVAAGEPDKSVIRQKLTTIIASRSMDGPW